jgi:hypothetical protein
MVGAATSSPQQSSNLVQSKFPPMFPTRSVSVEPSNYDIRKLRQPYKIHRKIGGNGLEIATANVANNAPAPQVQMTPVTPVQSAVQIGGAASKRGGSIKPLHQAEDLYKRVFLIAFLVFVSIYCATVTFQSKDVLKGVLKLKGEKQPADANLDNDDVNYMERWRRIAQVIIVLSLLAIAYFLAMLILMTLVIWVYFYLTSEDNSPITRWTLDLMSYIFWRFDLDGTDHIISYFYMLIVIIIFGCMMFFLVYHLFVKNYLKNLGYPLAVNTSKTNKPEFSNPTKFAYFYGLYLILLLLFFILLFSLYHLSTNTLLFPCLLYIIVAMMFMMLIYRYTIERSKPWRIGVLWLVYFVWTLFSFFFFNLGLD